MRVFYSHAMKTYGTEVEKREIASILEYFPSSTVVDPGKYESDPATGPQEIEYWLNVVDTCDCVVFSRLGGSVTIGVEKEVNYALRSGKPVYELRGGKVIPVTKPVGFLGRQRVVFHLGQRLRGIKGKNP